MKHLTLLAVAVSAVLSPFTPDVRAGKGTIYEGGVRVCALANWPKHIKAGTHVTEPIHMVDWFPTLVNLAGGTLKQKLSFDGLDVWNSVTQGAKSPHDAILLCGGPTRTAVRAGDWKMLVGAGGTNAGAATGSTSGKATPRKKKAKTAKFAASNAGDNIQLYNLATDIGEKRNLAEDQPERVAELKAILARFLDDAVEPGNPN